MVLVQEFAAGGNLFDMLQKYGGRLTEHVTVQMVLEPFLRVLQVGHGARAVLVAGRLRTGFSDVLCLGKRGQIGVACDDASHSAL